MTKPVITIEPDVSLLEAAKRMATKDVGSLVVTDKRGRIIGIITERDFLKAIAEGRDPRKTRVVERMSTPVLTCSVDSSIVSVLKLMEEKGTRHIPVVKNDELVGMVSSRDVLRARLVDVALTFHSLLFGYYKAISDVLKTGCTFLAPHVMDDILKIYEKSGINLVQGETLDEKLNYFRQVVVATGMLEDLAIVEEEKDKFLVEVKNCLFADPTHTLLAIENFICPWALLTASALKKATGRQVSVSFSEFIARGTKTYLTVV